MVKGVADVYPAKPTKRQVSLRLSRLSKLLGIEIPAEKALRILLDLRFAPKVENDLITCTVPSWRSDVYREADLIEEIARVHGYNKIPTERKIQIEVVPVDARQKFAESAATFLNSCGFYETINVDFVDNSLAELFCEGGIDRHLAVRDESRKNANLLRRTLLGSLLGVLKTNVNAKNLPCRVFEIADTFVPSDAQQLEQLIQKTKLSLVCDGDFRDVRGVIEGLLHSIDPDAQVALSPADLIWAQQGATITVNRQPIGSAGIVSKALAERLPQLVRLIEKLVQGEVGLVITGFAYVMSDGKALPKQLGIHDDTMMPSLLKLTARVHAANGKIAMQIVHAGVQTVLKNSKDHPVWGPSAVYDKLFRKTPKAMSQREIKQTVSAFAHAADRVKRARFDAVQIHGAHGYLISQFLSPLKNRRTDKYGGQIENRARFLLEVCRAVRKKVGRDFPVLVKLNAKDFVRGGFPEKDALFVAKRLDTIGIDALEISGGVPGAGDLMPARQKIRRAKDEAYFLPLANRIKRSVSMPVILVGGMRSLQTVNQILKTGETDL